MSSDRVSRSLALFGLLLASGCGVVLGVDVAERGTELDAPADGVTSFEFRDVSADDTVRVHGDNTRFSVHLDMLEWDHSGDTIRAELANHGDVVRLQMVGGESVSLVGLDAFIPADVATSLILARGTLDLSDLSAPVFASAGSITLHDVSAPVVADGSVTLDCTIPVDLTATGSVYGSTRAGGVVRTESNAQITLVSTSVSDFELDSSSDSQAGFLELYLPPRGNWTLHVETPGHVVIHAGNIDYDAPAEDSAAVDGLTFDIGLGGPEIRVTSSAGSILINEGAPAI